MSEEKNGESGSQKDQAETKPKLNEEQYKLLLSCSEKKDVTVWNKYREEHPDEEVWLQGAHFSEANLQDADLWKANLQDADFGKASLQGVDLHFANLQGADLSGANLQDAKLSSAHLEDALLLFAHLQGADLGFVNLQRAQLFLAQLQNADLMGANLKDTNLTGVSLQNGYLLKAKLHGATFTTAIVDCETLIWECEVNRYSKSERFTDFEGVGLDSVRIDPETKQLLEYNVRRKNWEEWYKSKSENKWIIRMRRLATSPVRLFWSISDYGLSTWRILLSFILLMATFATIYFVWGWVDYYLLGIKDTPGIVKELFIAPQAQQQMSDFYYCLMIYFRSVCFSIATMFSLGDISLVNTQFGCRWWFGHLILIVQMVTGYMLLGALITRFAILFTAGGPAGKFAKSELKEKAR
ncbi:MAG: pentapeptide repeat-containing protein [Sedimentisphaerales bacterium]